MTTELALRRAVARHPDEDTPRLAFADWLDEQGRHQQAEFVRGQVEYAATPADSPRRREVAFRCRQLLDAHEEAWLAPRYAFEGEWGWHRGFVETFQTTPVDLGEDDAALFDTHPFRRVWVRKLDGKADGLDLVPRDNGVAALDLMANGLTTNALKRLAKFKHFSHVTELGLMVNSLRDTAVKVLCGEDFFQRLSLVRLAGNPFTPGGRDQLRAHFGDRVSFAYDRDPDRLYTIQDDYLRAGWGSDHTQLQLLAGTQRQRLAVFDHAGTLLRTEERVSNPLDRLAAYAEQEARREAIRDAWLAELGYESATIKVKRFNYPDGVGLTPFNWWIEYCDRPNDPDRVENVERGHRWLDRGKYRFDFGGGDAWFDRDGEVTDT
jgi:uncharacterized protein (TIGR02996 family)